jgi:hypothetical protein
MVKLLARGQISALLKNYMLKNARVNGISQTGEG